MKVLQINSFFTVGGPPRIMNGIYDTLKEQGIECKIAAAREKLYVPENSIRIGSEFGVKINALFARIFDNEGLSAKAATKKLIKQIKEYDPDVIHLHNLHGYCINIEILFDYLKRCNKKVVWTLHDCWAFTGHCAHFSFAKCYKWKEQCINCPQKNSYPSSKVFSFAKRNFKKKKKAFTGVKNLTITTPSKWLADLAKESFLGEYPIEVINNGIDTDVFKYAESNIREKYGLVGKRIVLGVAQNWAERKGFEDYIEMSKKLSDEYKLVMIGLTPDQIKVIPENILGIERTNNIQELVEWYSAADVFANTTYEETFSNVNIEAQACGTPAITYRTGGSPETVLPENVVTQGSVDELVRKIKELCNNDYKSSFVCETDKYDRKVIFKKYINLYS